MFDDAETAYQTELFFKQKKLFYLYSNAYLTAPSANSTLPFVAFILTFSPKGIVTKSFM